MFLTKSDLLEEDSKDIQPKIRSYCAAENNLQLLMHMVILNTT